MIADIDKKIRNVVRDKKDKLFERFKDATDI